MGDSSDPAAFSSFDLALSRVEGFSGLGVGIFDQIAGIDIDHCIAEDGTFSELAQRVVDIMKPCYVEISPSGTGLRLLFLVKAGFRYSKEEFFIKKDDLEVYAPGMTSRFLTVTGNVIRPADLVDCTEQVKIVLDTFMRRPRAEKPAATFSGESILSDVEVLNKAQAAANGMKFSMLFNGNWQSFYQSQSEADLGLCCLLAFWCRNDPDQIDRLFRQSGLYRSKWDSRRPGGTYGSNTINRAIAQTQNVYQPQTKKTGRAALKTYRPEHFTDVSQADKLRELCEGEVLFTPQTSFLMYRSGVWEDGEKQFQGEAQRLTRLQLKEAAGQVRMAQEKHNELVEAQAPGVEIKAAETALKSAEAYRNYALQRQATSKIKASMTESIPGVLVDFKNLDADPFILNTPAGEVDLRSGELLPSDPAHFCTKQTAVSPGNDGKQKFADFLDALTGADPDLMEYLQLICGMAAIGKVFQEHLIIAVGSGGNGKSTFFNLIFRVFGSYAGMISSSYFVTGNRENNKAELAGVRGARFVLAKELNDGKTLDAAAVKNLCSTDPIYAEHKYRDGFYFEPSFSVILFTNALPTVPARDSGTWDRLIVVPFEGRFRGAGCEVKNYADVLFRECGPAVLSWVIQGAVKFCANGFKVDPPECVVRASREYAQENDWLQMFLEECCEVSPGFRESAGTVEEYFRLFCPRHGLPTPHTTVLKNALIEIGIGFKKTNKCRFYFGLRIKPQLVYDTGNNPNSGRVTGGDG